MAPSPTGPFHVGGARTALFNWLFARHNEGVFVLRIEDTDVLRSRAEYVDNIVQSFRWLGMDYEEGPEIGGLFGPYFQMERLHTYRSATERLLAKGAAYYCYCTPEELEAERKTAQANKIAYRYSRRCRNLTAEERRAHEAQGRKPTVRFAMPQQGTVSFDDLIRGRISFGNAELDDLVIVKSDGIPTYNFAVVVDDATMRITHVIRGEDHIPNTPKQIHIYAALGEETPEFAHLPMILGPDRSKLSKRHGALSVLEYRDLGYLPEVLVNYIALLGWSYDDKREIFTRDELISFFTLERVGKTGAIFNVEKLDWMNGYYIRAMPLDKVTDTVLPFLQKAGLLPPGQLADEQLAYARGVVALIQERMKRLAEAPELTEFFFQEELAYDASLLVSKGLTPLETRAALVEVRQHVEPLPQWEPAMLEDVLRALAVELAMKTGQLFGALRVAVTGRTVAPPLFQTMAVLGRDISLRRIDRAIELLEQQIAASAA
ncbi:MAG: glutamate--tRNA ligase [Chloroflexi bacterium]|nr:glutamate--tRNA ligase [Chloroflexota bacterium]